jgi:hypothetical protein
VNFLVALLGGKTQPLQDFLKLMKLSLILLGENDVVAVDAKVQFIISYPGVSQGTSCRWQNVSVYCLTMFLFREQFIVTAAVQLVLQHTCLFSVTINIKA